MSLRSKLLVSSLVVILALSGLYLTMSLAATGMVFGRYEYYVQKQVSEQLRSTLTYYYVKNGMSWEGIDEYIMPFIPSRERHPERIMLVLLDQREQPVLILPKTARERWPDVDKNNGIRVPVTVNDSRVGSLWLPSGPPMNMESIRSRVSTSLITTIIVFILVSSLIAFGISYLMANRISEPLKSLAEAARQLGRRQFGLRLPVTSQDEVGVVVQAFNNMSEELQRSEQARRNLVADVAHELRTPLTIIQGQLESIQQGVLPASVETVLPIHDEVIRLNRLVDDLRQLTLAEAGKLPLRRIPTDLSRSVLKVIESFQLEAEARGIELQVFNPGPAVTAKVDPDRFTQIVVNLLGNALRYTPAGGYVRVGLTGVNMPAEGFDLAAWCNEFSKTGGHGVNGALPAHHGFEGGSGLIVWVADQGPGIEPEKLPYIFERFYRADESRERGTGGIGLGLAIAREFVAAHGGQITVCNREGGGSLFAFVLPV